MSGADRADETSPAQPSDEHLIDYLLGWDELDDRPDGSATAPIEGDVEPRRWHDEAIQRWLAEDAGHAERLERLAVVVLAATPTSAAVAEQCLAECLAERGAVAGLAGTTERLGTTERPGAVAAGDRCESSGQRLTGAASVARLSRWWPLMVVAAAVAGIMLLPAFRQTGQPWGFDEPAAGELAAAWTSLGDGSANEPSWGGEDDVVAVEIEGSVQPDQGADEPAELPGADQPPFTGPDSDGFASGDEQLASWLVTAIAAMPLPADAGDSEQEVPQ